MKHVCNGCVTGCVLETGQPDERNDGGLIWCPYGFDRGADDDPCKWVPVEDTETD